MSVSPPEAPPYPTTPEDDHENDEASTSAYAEILVCPIDFNLRKYISFLFIYL